MSLGVSRAASVARIGIVGLAATIAFIAVTTDPADAARRRRAKAPAYNPPYASIVVDANSGKVLQGTNADLLRHPASLTKIMTLYMLFERLETGRIKLDTEMEVSEHASEQAPTKLGLRPGSTLNVEDAIKGLVTKSANDAAAVIAETLGGSEEKFAQMMTQKARGLGMTKTVYRNASGLPDMEQVTTARDQATLGRAIQERFPKYYRYFQTTAFTYRGKSIRNHNRLLGRVEGVDGIKTGYTRASGFNLVTSMRRGNRHLVAVVLGGRSGGSRDATMRNLVAEYIDDAATQRTVAAINERTAPLVASEPKMAVVEPRQVAALKFADAKSEKAPAPKSIDVKPAAPLQLAAAGNNQAAAATAPAQAQPAKQEPVMLSSGVVATQSLAPIPGSSDPITPTRVKTLQVRAGAVKTASTTSNMVASAMPTTNEPAQSEPAPVAAAVPVQAAPIQTASIARNEMPRQPANHGTGQGILGTLPASAMAFADPKATHAPAAAAVNAVSSQAAKPVTVASAAATIPVPVAAPAPAKPVVRSGWIVQVGAFDAEREARERLDEARGAVKQLGKADPFTEPVSKGSKTMYRARFAGLAQGDAEAACRALKRSDIPCIAIKN